MRSEKATLKSHAGDLEAAGSEAWLPLKDNPQEYPRTFQRLNCIRDTPLCASTVTDSEHRQNTLKTNKHRKSHGGQKNTNIRTVTKNTFKHISEESGTP